MDTALNATQHPIIANFNADGLHALGLLQVRK
jgi:hypothetical protein